MRERTTLEAEPELFDRIIALQTRLGARSMTETIRRSIVTMSELVALQDGGGEIVLCHPEKSEKVIWFL